MTFQLPIEKITRYTTLKGNPPTNLDWQKRQIKLNLKNNRQ